MTPYVIIGGGTAAVGCIEGIRTKDTKREIVVISKENHSTYCRPLISYCLEGKTNPVRMKYRDDDFYDKNKCKVLYGKSCIKIDSDNKKVILDDGQEIKYQSLCVATGSSPFVPPFSGLEKVKNKCTFMTLDDMLALKGMIDHNKNVLIVGAGLIGLKCAEAIAHSVKSVAVCDLADRVLSSILDSESAKLMQTELEKNNVCFMLGKSVSEFTEYASKFNDGTKLPFDVLVLAVGVRANTSLVKEIGGKVNRGIVTDLKSATSIKDVYAAGDCAEGFDVSSQSIRTLAIMPNAYGQGKCAGINMAEGNACYDKAIPMNSIGFFSMHAMTAGSYYSESEGGTIYESRTDGIKRFYVKDGYLTGFIIVGKIEKAGIYTNLIRERISLKNVDLDRLIKMADLSGISSEKRGKILGGVV